MSRFNLIYDKYKECMKFLKECDQQIQEEKNDSFLLKSKLEEMYIYLRNATPFFYYSEKDYLDSFYSMLIDELIYI